MKLINKEIGLSVIIEDILISSLYENGLKYYPKEFGGLLVGRYTEDKKTVIVQKNILPKQFKSSEFFFERGIKGLRKILNKIYSQSPSMYYVGEWHTHPDNPAIPSQMDLKALREIIQHDEVNIINPILLIMSINRKRYDLGVFVYFKNKIYRYEEEESR